MQYKNIIEATFIDRPNRFIAHAAINGKTETVHVKNTGRCKELLIPGVKIGLTKPGTPGRKTEYDLVSVKKENLGWVNIDSQAPNAVVKEWLESGSSVFGNIPVIRPEYKYGDSRIDFFLEWPDDPSHKKVLIEVKGCTLEIDGTGYFPDAPTLRGVKHLNELSRAIDDGYETYLAFVIALPGITEVCANTATHPEFGIALENAKNAGVKVMKLVTEVGIDFLHIV